MMELGVKETRMVVLGLRLLLERTSHELSQLDPEDEECGNLANDEVLLEMLIDGYRHDYQSRFGHSLL